jgi:hypothetical protein
MITPSGFPELARWANYYEIVGSAAGALTGLQFVVITLVAQGQGPASRHELRAFGTPTVVHFCVALLISAMMSAPWDALLPLGVSLATLGAAGFVYSFVVCRHARSQTHYAPDGEDWIWYLVLPPIAYAVLATGGVLLTRNATWSLVVVAAIAVLFLVIGIRNAWDTITYVTLKRREKKLDS